jgi:hypothetical protein
MQTNIDGTAAGEKELAANRKYVILYPPHRQVTSRFFFSLTTIYLIAWAVFDSNSRLHAVLSGGGLPALLSSLLLVGLGLAAFLDVTLNDVLPSRFSFYLNRSHRHVVWGGISVTYMGYAQIFSKSEVGAFGAGFFALMGLWSAAIAAMDVWYEYNERTKRNDAE